MLGGQRRHEDGVRLHRCQRIGARHPVHVSGPLRHPQLLLCLATHGVTVLGSRSGSSSCRARNRYGAPRILAELRDRGFRTAKHTISRSCKKKKDPSSARQAKSAHHHRQPPWPCDRAQSARQRIPSLCRKGVRIAVRISLNSYKSMIKSFPPLSCSSRPWGILLALSLCLKSMRPARV